MRGGQYKGEGKREWDCKWESARGAEWNGAEQGKGCGGNRAAEGVLLQGLQRATRMCGNAQGKGDVQWGDAK